MGFKVDIQEAEGFLARTRNGGADPLAELRPALAEIANHPGKVFNIAQTDKASEGGALVSKLNKNFEDSWTFISRNVDGTGIVQAMYDPENPRKPRAVRVPKLDENGNPIPRKRRSKAELAAAATEATTPKRRGK